MLKTCSGRNRSHTFTVSVVCFSFYSMHHKTNNENDGGEHSVNKWNKYKSHVYCKDTSIKQYLIIDGIGLERKGNFEILFLWYDDSTSKIIGDLPLQRNFLCICTWIEYLILYVSLIDWCTW